MSSDHMPLPFGIKGYSKPKTPLHQKALYLVAIVALIVIGATS